MTTTLTQPQVINGINVEALRDLIAGVRADAVKGHTHWGVTTCWKGGTLSETAVEGCQIGDQWIERQFKFRSDEPLELGGTNTFANPQEYLLGGLGYALFGSSKHLAIGPTSAMSLIMGVTLARLAGGDASRYLSLATLAMPCTACGWSLPASTNCSIASSPSIVGIDGP